MKYVSLLNRTRAAMGSNEQEQDADQVRALTLEAPPDTCKVCGQVDWSEPYRRFGRKGYFQLCNSCKKYERPFVGKVLSE